MSSARGTALHLLSRRDYTAAEIRRKLTDREFPDDEIESAIQGLQSARLLDDRRAGAAHIRTASRLKHRGRLRIQRELEARGIDRAVVRELMAEWPGADEAEALQHVLRRRRASGPLSPAERRRLFQQMLRRGFAADLIAKALRSDEHDD
jgi:regulatory protein